MQHITSIPTPHTPYATKLLTNLPTQCTSSTDLTAAPPILFNPSKETSATATPIAMHSSNPHKQLRAIDEVQNFSMAPKMIRKKMRPAISETEKLYFMKMSAVCIMREHRLSKIQFCWAGDYSVRYQGRTSINKLAIAHSRGTRDSTTANITTPDCVSGARPSGVEEPTISSAISIDIDY